MRRRLGLWLAKKTLTEILVRDHLRIVVELDRLGVVTQVVVGGVVRGAPGVADPGPYHSVEAAKLGLAAPESAQGERGRLEDAWCGRIHEWNLQKGRGCGLGCGPLTTAVLAAPHPERRAVAASASTIATAIDSRR